jgi:hypothetical protein
VLVHERFCWRVSHETIIAEIVPRGSTGDLYREGAGGLTGLGRIGDGEQFRPDIEG